MSKRASPDHPEPSRGVSRALGGPRRHFDIFASALLRRALLFVWGTLTLAAAVAAVRGFRIDNSVGVWFARDDPALVDYRTFLRDFGSREWLLVVLERTPASPGALDAERNEVVTALRGMKHVRAVLSAADVPTASELARTILKPRPESSTEALLVQITNDIDEQDAYREDLVSGIRTVAETFPTVTHVRVAGIAVINGELNRSARRDMYLFFPAVALFLTLLGLLFFRNIRDTLVLLAVSMGTVVGTQGLLLGVGYPLNMITIMLPTVLVALSVADAVHLIHVFHTRRSAGGDRVTAARRAVRQVIWPCAGTSLTTVAGFLSFSRSSVGPVFQLALFASFGIVLAWVLTMTVAPVLLAELWGGHTRHEPAANALSARLLHRWSTVPIRHRGWVLATFALGCLSLVGLSSLNADTNYVEFFRSGSRVRQDYRAIRDGGFPQNPLNLVLQAPRGTSALTPENLPALASFAQRVRGIPGVHAVLSPLMFAGARGMPGEDTGNMGGMLSSDSSQVQLILMIDYLSSKELFALLDQVRSVAAEVLPPEIRMVPTGTSLLWAGMDEGVIRTQKQSLGIVSVVCLGLLFLLFRSLPLAVLGMALGLLPVGMVLGLMGFWGIPVNLATVLIAGIAVGLAVDDTIHFVHEYQTLRRAGSDRSKATETAMEAVGLRMVVTSCILVGSFAIMGLSDFLPTAQFGLLSSLTIVLALLADLALLPALLSWTPRIAAIPAWSGSVPGGEAAVTHSGEDSNV
jgi:predicted RND superfamily exporter protein